MRFHQLNRILLLFLLMAFCSACSNEQTEIAKQPAIPRNIYMITATGLRADHLSSYIYQPIQTPGLDYLAYDGIRFTKAFSTSTDSLPAHQSILTGLYPTRKPLLQMFEYFQTFTSESFPEIKTAIPLILRNKGYRTAAFAADPELRSFVLRSGWFEKAYAGDSILPPWQPSSDNKTIQSLTIDWISTMRGQPHFVFMNFSEPTPPYEPPKPYSHHYENHPYDGEVAAIDQQVGTFIHWLKQAKLFDQSIVIFTAPYGENPESLGRAGSCEDENFEIPLMIAAPGLLPRQQTYETGVSLVDVYPTLLAMLDLPAPSEIDGKRLFEKNSDKQITHESVYGSTLFSMHFGKPAVIAKLIDSSSPQNPVDKDLIKLEEAIVLSRSSRFADALSTLEDPGLPETPSILSFRSALLTSSGRLDDAEKELRPVHHPELLIRLADLQVKQGKIKQAYETICKYKERMSYDSYSIMSIILRTAGNFEAAQKNAELALKLNSRSVVAFHQQALISFARRDLISAEGLFRKVLLLEPNNLEVRLELAETLMKLEKKDEAKRLGAALLIQSETPEIRERARILLAE